MKKLFYKFLLWFFTISLNRALTIYEKQSEKMSSCLTIIAALMEKGAEIEDTYKANIELSVACLPNCLDQLKNIVLISNRIKEGNGFISTLQGYVNENEKNNKKMIDMVNSGMAVSRMKHELETAMQATFYHYFQSQNKAVHLKHMCVMLHRKIERLNKLCKE